jgi:hypothetical protein
MSEASPFRKSVYPSMSRVFILMIHRCSAHFISDRRIALHYVWYLLHPTGPYSRTCRTAVINIGIFTAASCINLFSAIFGFSCLRTVLNFRKQYASLQRQIRHISIDCSSEQPTVTFREHWPRKSKTIVQIRPFVPSSPIECVLWQEYPFWLFHKATTQSY